jgi:hypothetical protein
MILIEKYVQGLELTKVGLLKGIGKWNDSSVEIIK